VTTSDVFHDRSRATRGVLLLATLLTLTACTARQSQDQYEERLDQAVATRTTVSGQLAGDDLADADAYAAAAAEVERAVDELDADAPPRNLQDAHERMVAGMQGLGVLLERLGRCEALARADEQDRRACRQAIGQDAYDTIRNDFDEANTIYRQEGVSVAGIGGDDDAGDDTLGEDPGGGDAL
jgi:hypothetical protein